MDTSFIVALGGSLGRELGQEKKKKGSLVFPTIRNGPPTVARRGLTSFGFCLPKIPIVDVCSFKGDVPRLARERTPFICSSTPYLLREGEKVHLSEAPTPLPTGRMIPSTASDESDGQGTRTTNRCFFRCRYIATTSRRYEPHAKKHNTRSRLSLLWPSSAAVALYVFFFHFLFPFRSEAGYCTRGGKGALFRKK